MKMSSSANEIDFDTPRRRNVALVLVLALGILTGACVVYWILREEPKLQEYMESVSEIRGLEFKQQVSMQTITREDLRDYLAERLDKYFPSEKLEKVERTIQAFGLFPQDKDLREIVLDFQSQQVMGFYDPETKEFYRIEEGEMEELVAIHELTHALQDQHFDLQTLPMRKENNDDLSLAVTALVEGDAQYVTLDYTYRKAGENLQTLSSYVERVHLQMMNTAQPIPRFEDFPIFLTKIFIFPYTGGLLFVMEGWTENWDKINGAYADLPASTEQILHPEKYFENRDYPTVLTLPKLDPVLGTGWELQENNNFGEYALGALLLHFFQESADVQVNLEAREGWDGDSYLSYYNENENLVALAWLSTWDSEEDSVQFQQRYRELLGRKYPDAEIITEEENLLILRTENNRVLLQRKQRDVLVLEGIPAHQLQNVVTEIWEETGRHELKIVERVSEEY
jgi:hypothetical protein